MPSPRLPREAQPHALAPAATLCPSHVPRQTAAPRDSPYLPPSSQQGCSQLPAAASSSAQPLSPSPALWLLWPAAPETPTKTWVSSAWSRDTLTPLPTLCCTKCTSTCSWAQGWAGDNSLSHKRGVHLPAPLERINTGISFPMLAKQQERPAGKGKRRQDLPFHRAPRLHLGSKTQRQTHTFPALCSWFELTAG